MGCGEVLRIGLVLFLWLPHMATAWTIRAATSQDIGLARKVLLQEAMNPLSVSTEFLLVAANDDAPDTVLGFGQIRPLDGSDYTELASLYVFPDHRRQGIASALIESLLERQQQADSSSSVCLLTLRPTMPLYEKFGFGIVDPKRNDDTWKTLPQTVRLEYQAGSLLSLVLGNDLVCMVR
jgi:GNAT superfamily N-acetyltransferase